MKGIYVVTSKSLCRRKFMITTWYKDGLIHTDDDHPSICHSTGSKFWHKNGVLHRDNGPAIMRVSGTREWWVNGQLHRKNKPAVEGHSVNVYYKHGLLHRIDGPAVDHKNSGGLDLYAINGDALDTEEVNEWINNHKVDLSTEFGKFLFVLRFSDFSDDD